MIITKRKHEEVIKAKDLQIEGLNTRLSAQSSKIAALEARLAPFERIRGAGGRFVKKP
jgi:predicted RNase H-like nuclease (RuvC/YqgF family)